MSEIYERQAEIDDLLTKMSEGSSSEAAEPLAETTGRASVNDEALIAKASMAKNGAKFSRLYAGETAGYPSHSEADAALCAMLSFWTNKDRTAVDRLFRRSGLYRLKWDKIHFGDGRTYGEATIARAIAATKETFGPRLSTGDWRKNLIGSRDESGKIKFLERVLANAILILESDSRWRGVLAFDEFFHRITIKERPPYRGEDFVVPSGGLAWTDDDDIRTTEWLQREYLLLVNTTIAHQAVQAVAAANPVHPVREYVASLKWDGEPRIDDWLVRYLGAKDSPYARAVGSRWLISAVARVFDPGCKADHVLIFEGRQGLLKSTALLAISHPWFTDEIDTIGSKDAAIQLLGVWVVEMPELDAMNRPEISRVKSFLSKSFDRYRPPYGRNVVQFERQCVFAGTVNHSEYLRDETGNRRFWPVQVFGIGDSQGADVKSLERDRDQLWAEAAARYRAGEPWWLDSQELAALAAKEQDKRLQIDAWEPVIGEFLESKEHVAIHEVLRALGFDTDKIKPTDQYRVVRTLRHLGWTRRQRRVDGKRCWVYARPSPPSPDEVLADGDDEDTVTTGLSPTSPLSPLNRRFLGKTKPPENEKVQETQCDGGDDGDAAKANSDGPASKTPLGEPCSFHFGSASAPCDRCGHSRQAHFDATWKNANAAQDGDPK